MLDQWIFEEDNLSKEDLFLLDLKNKIKEIPLSDILEHHGVQLTHSSGGNIFGYCPFHPDATPKSFSVNNDMKICKCFSCGKGGDAIKFIELTENLSYSDAILKLATDEGLITKDQFETMSKLAYSDENLHKKTGKFKTRKRKEKTSEYMKMANDVYSLFPMIFGLSDEDIKYLQEERHIQNGHLGCYFTVGKYNTKKIIHHILKIYPEYKETLKNLAGFYETNNKIELAIPEGIGILIRNANGYITGIQVRRRHIKENEQRYVWLSSNFAKYSKFCSGGSSPGTPIDVIAPEETDGKNIAIVEGKFKSEILAQNGFISASVQGVGNFAGIEKEIKHFPSVKTAYIFYDADMLHNTAVLNQAVKLGVYLNEKCPNLTVKYCIWDESLGKGIDDLILAGHKDTVKAIPQDNFTAIFNETLDPLMEKHGFTRNNCKLTKEERDSFNQELKELLMSRLF